MSEEAQELPEAVVRRSRTERILEAALMLFCAVFFLFMLEESTKWSSGVGLLPRIACIFGLIVLAAYAIQRFRPSKSRGQIMDMGFDEEGLERSVIIERTIRFVGTTAAFFVGIWLIGFHIAVPLYMLLYLIIYGKLRWWTALLSALGFLLFMVVAYDMVIRDTWPEPVIRLPLPGVRY
jgi:tripartite tricarboxylate transporter TctB family protein